MKVSHGGRVTMSKGEGGCPLKDSNELRVPLTFSVKVKEKTGRRKKN